MLFVLVGAIGGAYVATRPHTIFALASVVLFCAVGAILTGIVAHHGPLTIAIEALGAVTAPQVAFVAVSLGVYLKATSHLTMHRSVQAAIGNELRTEFKVPRGLPPRIAALVGKLKQA
jgi:hypothetical protein